MTRSKFNADVEAAASTGIESISDVMRGDDDGQVCFVYTHPTLDISIPIRIFTVYVDGYPNHPGFLAYTDSDNVPPSVAKALDSLSGVTSDKSVVEALRILSTKLQAALTQNGSGPEHGPQSRDTEMTDVDEDYDYDDEDQDYDEDEDFLGAPLDDFDDGTFGIEPQTVSHHPARLAVEISPALVSDLRQAKEVGMSIGILTEQGSNGIFSLSVPVSMMGLPEETLTAWEVNPKQYLVLLCKYVSGYRPLSLLMSSGTLGSSAGLEFRFGACDKFKPSLASATEAFANSTSDLGISSPANGHDSDGEFQPLNISHSLDMWMKAEFGTLLHLRLKGCQSWDHAKQELDKLVQLPALERERAYETLGDKAFRGHDGPVISAAPCSSLNRDNLLEEPRRRSLPLIAMQFALYYFTGASQYCMTCHRRLDNGGSPAMKPYVCDEPLCLYQYMALGLGADIESEVLRQPYVVDLLISLFYAALDTRQLREYPKGLGLRVPILGPELRDVVPGFRDQHLYPQPFLAHMDALTPTPTRSGPANEEDDNNRVPLMRADLRRGRLWPFDSQDDSPTCPLLSPGDLFVLAPRAQASDPTTSTSARTMGLFHCRVDSQCQITGVVLFECFFKTHKVAQCCHSITTQWDLPQAELTAEVYPYSHDLEDLSQDHQRQALMVLLQTTPSVKHMCMRFSHKEASTKDGSTFLSKPALKLLRWIVASNRSLLVEIDCQPKQTKYNTWLPPSTVDRAHEKLSGLDPGWVQFRFAQGSLERDRRFNQAIEAHSAHKDAPTIFAWHGSPLGNWHGIIREGLNFDRVTHGRAHGDGVYFSPSLTTSMSYTRSSGGRADIWPHSLLDIKTAISLCEIVNKVQDFTRQHPHYVLQHLDWIQCRYLLVKGTEGVSALSDTSERTSQTAADYLSQDPLYPVLGLNDATIRIPRAAIPHSRRQPLGAHPIHTPIPASTHPESALSIASGFQGEGDHDDFHLISGAGIERGKDCTTPTAESPLHLDEGVVHQWRPGHIKYSSLPKLPSPAWAAGHGQQVLAREIRKLQKLQVGTPAHKLGWYIDFGIMENLFHWIVELHTFNRSLPLGKAMHDHNVSSVVLEIRFGPEFPLSPPFVRVIQPRFLPFSSGGGGHVTAGGAICMELLTTSGWSPVLTMESVLLQVRMALESTEPRPAQLDRNFRDGRGDLRSYGIHEAIQAYKRSTHAHGWKVPPDFEQTVSAFDQ
ncbi:hypothetical protein ACRALDRAFT_2023808 [Sodiomyces alcalophilus JCM 7366]|uniref:uncharacterized protein n=1 Tax=Sodiomyces alcalophilus JCM 7366 TaxID=591952 RepID=UPI0039B5338A